LEKQGISLSDSLNVIENTQNKLSEFKYLKGKTLAKKLNDNKNCAKNF
jgi:hypothetical protein